MDWIWDVKKEEVLDDLWSRQKDRVAAGLAFLGHAKDLTMATKPCDQDPCQALTTSYYLHCYHLGLNQYSLAQIMSVILLQFLFILHHSWGYS